MNKVLVSSRYFLDNMRIVNRFDLPDMSIRGDKKGNRLIFGAILYDFDCHCQNDFLVTLYRKPLRNLIKFLELLEEQPITLQFEDSEVFNIKILSAVL